MKASLIRLYVLGIIALIALGVAGCSPKSVQGESLTQSIPIPLATVAANENKQVVNVEMKSDTGKHIPEEVEIQATRPEQDGSALLQLHCGRCHPISMLEKTQKSRSDWERILSRMERTGVRLSKAEKSALLEYLVTLNNR